MADRGANDSLCLAAAELGPESAPRFSLGAFGETACGESASKRAAGRLTEPPSRSQGGSLSLSTSMVFGFNRTIRLSAFWYSPWADPGSEGRTVSFAALAIFSTAKNSACRMNKVIPFDILTSCDLDVDATYEGGTRGKSLEPLVRRAAWERRLRHQSRVEKLAEKPKVREGRLLDDDRAWMDW
jgi:hypothetical protein